MNLIQIQYFMTLAEELNFSKAAEKTICRESLICDHFEADGCAYPA